MMSYDRLEDWARPVAAAAAALFIVDLFLSWQRTTVHVAGAVQVHHMASGWSGWGALAGVCAVALLVFVIAGRMPAAATAAAGAAMFVLAVLAVATGDAHVGMHGRGFGVEVDTTRWPAWLGLGLAAIAGLASSVPLMRQRGEVDRVPTAPKRSA
jgi:hypothetical protein